MRLANSLTSLVCDLEAASLPASMSTWFAVTTMAAICASLGPSAAAAAVVRHRLVAITTPIILIIKLLTLGSCDAHVRHPPLYAASFRCRELDAARLRCVSSGGRSRERPALCEDSRDDTIAPFAPELEDIAGRQVELTRQRLAQHPAGPEQTRPHGRFGDRKTRRGLGHRQLLELPQSEHTTKCHRQFVDLALQQAPHVRSRGGLLRRLGRFLEHSVRSAAGRVGSHFVEVHDDSVAVTLASKRERLVDDDARQPRRELCVGAKVGDVAIRGEICFLQNILGVSGVLENGASNTKEPAVVAAHQEFERAFVVTPDAPCKLCIVDRSV